MVVSITPSASAQDSDQQVITAPGSYQSEIGCPPDLGANGDWAPDCLLSQLLDEDGDGIYTLILTTIPAGDWEVKIAVDQSWLVNYGLEGQPDGPNIPFTVSNDGDIVAFVYDSATHILTVQIGRSTPTPQALFTPTPIISTATFVAACAITTPRRVNQRRGPGMSFDRVGRLPSGASETADGQAAGDDGFNWYRLTDETWVRADVVTAEAACAGLPTIAPEQEAVIPPTPAPTPTLPPITGGVNVTIAVEAPSNTNSPVYIAGDFKVEGYPVWDPSGIVMEETGPNLWQITLQLPANVTIEYKFVRGDWSAVEKGAGCEEIANRSLTITPDAQGNLVVTAPRIEKWRDLDNCP
jgi:hypothetical protein